MKKRNLCVTVIVVLAAVISGGTHLYSQSGHRQENVAQSIQNHIGDFLFLYENFQKETPRQQQNNPPKSGEANISIPPSSSHGGNNTVTTASKPSSQTGTDSLRARIEQKYLTRLESLAAGYEAKLNGLVAAALNECNTAKKAAPNADITPIISKYYSAGKTLEAECDSKFYAMLASFESELKANSFPLDAAIKAKETYEARKSARSGQLTAGK